MGRGMVVGGSMEWQTREMGTRNEDVIPTALGYWDRKTGGGEGGSNHSNLITKVLEG